MNHLLLPAKQGMRQYLDMPIVNATVAERQLEILQAGNKKAQFNAYCAMFPRKTAEPKAPKANVDPRIAELEARIAELRSEVVAEPVEDVRYPFGVGTSFSYAGQNGVSKWLVVSDGLTTKKSKTPAFGCTKVGGNGQVKAWSKGQIARGIESGKISL